MLRAFPQRRAWERRVIHKNVPPAEGMARRSSACIACFASVLRMRAAVSTNTTRPNDPNDPSGRMSREEAPEGEVLVFGGFGSLGRVNLVEPADSPSDCQGGPGRYRTGRSVIQRRSQHAPEGPQARAREDHSTFQERSQARARQNFGKQQPENKKTTRHVREKIAARSRKRIAHAAATAGAASNPRRTPHARAILTR